jgi:hypothetical protein
VNQPTQAQLDALAAWWLAKRHIGKAATLLGKRRQTVANQLQQFKREQGAADCVELALEYLDEIERRKSFVLGRAA